MINTTSSVGFISVGIPLKLNLLVEICTLTTVKNSPTNAFLPEYVWCYGCSINTTFLLVRVQLCIHEQGSKAVFLTEKGGGENFFLPRKGPASALKSYFSYINHYRKFTQGIA